MKKKLKFIGLVFLGCMLSTNVLSWTTTINSVKNYEKFIYDEDTEMYTGDIERVYMEKKAPDGKIYVLYDLTVEQKENDDGTLESSDYSLKIGNDIYPRQMDDYFLLNYHFRPLTHLGVKLGTHKGQIIFEIPVNQKDLPKTLLYKKQPVK